MVDRSSESPGLDPLTPVFAALRMQGLVLATAELTSPWGFRAEGFDDVAFYFAARGGGYLEHRWKLEPMGAGDVVIVAPRTPHSLRDHPRSPVLPLRSLQSRLRTSARRVRSRVVPGATTMIFGCFRFNPERREYLLSCLPPVIHLRVGDADAPSLHVIQALAAETGSDGVGRDAIRIRLAEVLFIHALRACLRGSKPARGWLRALADPGLSRALTAFHLAPREPWTIASLAAVAGMSRSVFAARFTGTVGRSPLAYVKAWRMGVAATLLEGGSLGLKQIAEYVGYGSDESFSRAFSHVMGTTPGAYRARHRTSP